MSLEIHRALPSRDQPKAIQRETATEATQEEKLYAQADRLTKALLVSLEAKHGLVSPEHASSQFCSKVAERLRPYLQDKFQGFRILILDNCDGEVGFALPDGTVVFSKSLLEKIHTEDELAALLGHELTHVDRKHGLEKLRTITKKNLNLETYLGNDRMAEYEADIIPLVTLLPKAGYQPLAGATLFQRLQDEFDGKEWSLAHGGLEDRRLNLLSVTYVLDLPGIERIQTALPQHWKTWMETEQSQEKSAVRQTNRQLREQLLQQPDAKTWEDLSVVLIKHYSHGLEGVLTKDPSESSNRLAMIPPMQLSPYTARVNFPGRGEIVEFWELGEAINTALRAKYATPEERAPMLALLLQYRIDIPILKLVDDPNTHKIRPAIELLDLPIESGNDESKFLGYHLTNAVIDLGLDAFTQSLDPEYWKELKAYADLESDRLLDCIIFADSLDAFHDLESGTFNWGLLNEQVRRFLAAINQLEVSVGYTRSDFALLKTNLLDHLRRKYGFSAKELEACLPEIIAEPMEPQSKEVWTGRLTSLVRESDSPEVAELAELIDRRVLMNQTNNRDADRSFVRTTFRTDEEVQLHDDLAVYLKHASPTFAASAKLLFERLPLVARSFIGLDLLGDIIESRDSYNSLDGTDVTFRDALSEFLTLLAKPDYTTSDQDFRHVLEQYLFFTLGESAGDLDVDRAIAFLRSVTSNRFEGNRQWIHRHRDVGYLLHRSMIGKMAQISDPQTAFTQLEAFCTEFEFDLYGAIAETTPERFTDYFSEQQNILEHSQKLIERLWPHAKNDFGRILTLSNLFIDSDIRRRLRNAAYDQLLEGLTYQQARDVILSPALSASDTAPVIERLVEQLAQTPAELETLKIDMLTLYQRHRSEAGSTGTHLDAFLRFAFHKPARLLHASLVTRSSDQELIALAFEEWWQRIQSLQYFKEYFDPHQLDYFDDPKHVAEWVEESGRPVLEQILGEGNRATELFQTVTISQVRERLLRSSLTERHLILRKLLMDRENGLLKRRSKLQPLILTLVDEHVVMKNEHRPEVERLVQALAEATSDEELYFLVAPLLAQAMFQEPSTTADARKVVRSKLFKLETADHPREEFWDRPIYSGGSTQYKKLGPAMAEKAYRWAFAEYEDAPTITWAEEGILKELPAEYRAGLSLEKRGEVAAMIDVVTRLGAPGVRFLQLLGQYIHIPQELEQEFAVVYDNVRGQSKLSAFQTIQREAPQLLEGDDRLGNRIGGGSLMTAYTLTKPNRIPLVVKVLNPNAAYRVRESIGIVSRAAAYLSQSYPDQAIYRIVKEQLLPDIERWLLSDIADERFIANDRIFHKQWNGWTSKGHSFSIRIPESFDVGTHKVKVEEFIAGTNLTQLQRANHTNLSFGLISESDYRDAVSLAIKHYDQQLRSGLLHSDVHAGNIRLTHEKQVAILDRNFYLELEDRDKRLLLELLVPFGNPVKKVLKYLFDQPQEQTVLQNRTAIETQILGELKDFSLVDAQAARDALAVIKSQGLQVPLRITLLLKNLNALNKMAQSAGFTSVAEARNYRPDRAR